MTGSDSPPQAQQGTGLIIFNVGAHIVIHTLHAAVCSGGWQNIITLAKCRSPRTSLNSNNSF